jgi:hypothetical protein
MGNMHKMFSSEGATLFLSLCTKLQPRLSSATSALISLQAERQFPSTNTWLKELQSPASPVSLKLKAQFQNTNTCAAASDVTNNDLL